MKKHKQQFNEKLKLCEQAVVAGKPHEALEYIKEMEKLSLDGGDLHRYTYTRLRKAIIYSMLHEYTIAIPLYNEVWETIVNEFDEGDILLLYLSYSNSCSDLGDIENAMLYAVKGRDIAINIGDKNQLMRFNYAIAQIYERLGEYSRMIPFLDEILPVAEELGDSRYITRVHGIYGKIYYLLNESEKAKAHLEVALKTALDNEHFHITPMIYAGFSQLENDYASDNNLHHLLKQLEHARLSYSKGLVVRALYKVGIWYSLHGKHREALRYSKEAVSVAATSEDTVELLSAQMSLAKVYCDTSKLTMARKLLDAIDINTERHLPDDVVRTYYEIWYILEKLSGNVEQALEWHEKLSAQKLLILEKEKSDTASLSVLLTRVQDVLKSYEQEKIAVSELKKSLEARSQELLALSLEVEEKRSSLKKIKKIALDSLSIEESALSKKGTNLKDTLNQYLVSVGNDETSWARFQQNLDTIHPEFTKKLIEMFPTLTPTQIKVCCLLRLQMSTKEIVEILKVSKKTVDHHREHIRKKLGIAQSVNLSTFLLHL